MLDYYKTGKEADETSIRDIIEGFMDARTPSVLLDALADVCREKAEHLRSNWQDENGAAGWEKMARTVERASVTLAGVEA